MRRLLALATLALVPSIAHAQPGCSLGGGLGYGFADASTTSLDGLNFHSTQPNVQVRGECGYRFESSPFYIGAFGEYQWQNEQFSFGTSNVAIGDGYDLGARVGYIVGNAMPYVGAAYQHSTLTSNLKGLPSSLEGIKFSGGVEFAPFANFKYITVSPEVTYTDYQEITINETKWKNKDLAAMLRVNIALFAPADPTPVQRLK